MRTGFPMQSQMQAQMQAQIQADGILSHLVTFMLGLVLGMKILCCLFPFFPTLSPNVNEVSCEMWAFPRHIYVHDLLYIHIFIHIYTYIHIYICVYIYIYTYMVCIYSTLLPVTGYRCGIIIERSQLLKVLLCYWYLEYLK